MPTTIDDNTKIAVLGLGYVGLPLLFKFWSSGLSVVGFDTHAAKIQQLQAGESPIEDVSDIELQSMIRSERCALTDDSALLSTVDALFICVPTPLSASREPDLSFILSAVDTLIPVLQPYQLVVLESTTYPGTTEELIVPLLEKTGLQPGKDISLAFSPERIDPSNTDYPVGKIPKVVGGISARCSERACELYRYAGIATHVVSSPRVAEAAKILENTFRSVNIALVNEFAQICNVLCIDVWEVIEAAATKPFGFMKFTPGPGIGGHCIPLDPHYLMWKTRFQGFEPRFISLADQVNREMPHYIVQRSIDILNTQKKPLNGSRILLCGVAYKANVSDAREAPAVYLWPLLAAKGAEVAYHDPHVKTLTLGGQVYTSQSLSAEPLRAYDLVIILTPHDAIDYAMLNQKGQLIFDTRQVLLPRLQQQGQAPQAEVVTL